METVFYRFYSISDQLSSQVFPSRLLCRKNSSERSFIIFDSFVKNTAVRKDLSLFFRPDVNSFLIVIIQIRIRAILLDYKNIDTGFQDGIQLRNRKLIEAFNFPDYITHLQNLHYYFSGIHSWFE